MGRNPACNCLCDESSSSSDSSSNSSSSSDDSSSQSSSSSSGSDFEIGNCQHCPNNEIAAVWRVDIDDPHWNEDIPPGQILNDPIGGPLHIIHLGIGTFGGGLGGCQAVRVSVTNPTCGSGCPSGFTTKRITLSFASAFVFLTFWYRHPIGNSSCFTVSTRYQYLGSDYDCLGPITLDKAFDAEDGQPFNCFVWPDTMTIEPY